MKIDTPKSQHGTVTITMLAEICGTSKQVVSSILSEGRSSSKFSKKTYERVKSVAKEYNYRPNRTSVNLASGRHGSITILFKNFYKIPHNSINFLVRYAENYRQTVNLEVFNENKLPRCVSENSTDGVIIFEDLDPAINENLHQLSIPHVLINTCEHATPNSITFDEEGMMRDAMRYFSEHGRKIPIIVINDNVESYDKRRLKTVMEEHADFGLESPIVLEAYKYKTPVLELEKIVADNPHSDCIFISNYFNKYATYVEKLSNCNSHTIAFEFPVTHHYQLPALEFTIHQVEVPEKAVDLLNKIIDGKEVSGPILMRYNMEIRS